MLLVFVRSFSFGGFLSSSDNLTPLLKSYPSNIYARAKHRYAPTLAAFFLREYGRGRRQGKRAGQTQRYSAGEWCVSDEPAEATGELAKVRSVSS